MRFSTEIVQGVRVVALQGNFTGGPDSDGLRDAFGTWLANDELNFVIDLVDVELLNSIGLGTLVACYSSCSRAKATLKLSGLSERNRRAAYVARILDMFEAFDDRDGAVRSFQDAAAG